MQNFILTVIIVMVVRFCSFAQNTEAAPADVLLNFTTENDRHQFHLGEFIPITYSYAATTPGKYAWVMLNSKLVGGRGIEITCSPSAESARRLPPWVTRENDKFEDMLYALCRGGRGSAGGFGSGCGDCDGEQPLGNTPLGFGLFPLNMYVRFRTPGRYACIASSAEVTTSSSTEKIRHALLVKSQPLDLEIVDDPEWSRSAAAIYASDYDKSCRGNDVPEHNFLQCSNTSRQITYLDTADSLAVEVKFFDGRNHGWDNGFWDAIQHTSYPKQAVRFMAARIQEPDFEVSTSTLEWLASADLRNNSPAAFEAGLPASYHEQAIQKLRKYVRLLGRSLSRKNSIVLKESEKTYSFFAKDNYCAEKPLISEKEQARLLPTVKSGKN